MSIETLFGTMKDFLHDWTIVQSDQKLLIVYSYNIYDLVDVDLDYNEDVYANLIEKFEHIIVTECKSRFLDIYPSIEIVISRHIMLNMNICEKMISLEKKKHTVVMYA